LCDAQTEDSELVGHLLQTVKNVAEREGLTNGYRVVINTGNDGGQDKCRLGVTYIMQQATASGYKTLVPSNWQEIPDLTVANLYCYFKDKDKQKVLA
jgi:hypothetical protein